MVSKEARRQWTPKASPQLKLVLEAWGLVQTQPDSYIVPESSIPRLLSALARQLSGGMRPVQAVEQLLEFFIKACAGQVHFLYVWRAFSKVIKLHAKYDSTIHASTVELMTTKFEEMRDVALSMLEKEVDGMVDAYQSRVLKGSQLAETISSTADLRSKTDMLEDLCGSCGLKASSRCELSLSLDEFTDLLLSWHHDVTSGQLKLAATPAVPAAGQMSVLLHIYDVCDDVHKLNKILAHEQSPLKFGGIFHAGIEVNGLEWSFSIPRKTEMAGISCVLPRLHPQYRYRQTVQLRPTVLSPGDVAGLISELLDEFPGDSYDLLRRNCCHFADEFSRRLGAGRIPGWVHRLARVGALVDDVLQRFSKAHGQHGLVKCGNSVDGIQSKRCRDPISAC